MEKGARLEDRRSKKGKFFKMVRETPRWRLLESYEQVVTDYDDTLRTPEFHKYSVLRSQVFGQDPVDPSGFFSSRTE